ncbi:MAG TPA: ABC transporter ATP-binding protein [Gemmatimonadaceae bacterium]|nr:ABC transporter ATP-binding protein [Gemmatimonadaceae bacterium]
MATTPARATDATLPDLPEPELVFRARALRKVYGMGEVEVHALRSVDLDVRRGELLVMLGASGSGKSTLLNILGGLDVPTSGAVTFEGRDLAAADEKDRTRYRREQVGFVFQFYNLIPSLTARENVSLVTDIATDPMPAEEALQRAGLGDRMDHFPSQLSGGEQQRVAIARAIAKRPAILLCDEPTGALDYETGKLVLDALSDVNREIGTTIIIITHNVAIGAMGDRVIHLSSGTISETEVNERRAMASELSW